MTKNAPIETHKRLARARQEAGYATASDAARAFGWNENTYRSHENGERGLRIDTANKYANAFKVDVGYLLLGKEENITFSRRHNLLVGYVDSEAYLVEYPADGKNGFNEFVASNPITSHGICWFVEVTAQRPLFGCNPGDLLAVFSGDLMDGKIENFVGSLAIIELDDGRQILRRLRVDKDMKNVDVQMYPELPAEFIRPRSIHPIYAIVPRGFWQKDTRKDYDARLEDFKKNRLPELAKAAKK